MVDRDFIYVFRLCFYLCFSIFKNIGLNCKLIYNVFCIIVWELNYKYYLYLCCVVLFIGCYYSFGLLELIFLGSGGVIFIWYSYLYGILFFVVFFWYELANEVM